MYKNYHIYPENGGYSYQHDEYDGAPLDAETPSEDRRCGWAKTIEAAKAEIDEIEGAPLKCDSCKWYSHTPNILGGVTECTKGVKPLKSFWPNEACDSHEHTNNLLTKNK